MIQQSIKFGSKTIPFTIHFAARKSLSIQVRPDCSVHAIAPLNTPETDVVNKVKQKAGWILKQQEHFISFHPRTPERKFINGETHLYMGRQYRLKKVQSEQEGVRIYRGQIEVHSPGSGEEGFAGVLNDWYKKKAKEVFNELIDDVMMRHKRLHGKKISLHIKHMTTRWGSCSPTGRISLNTDLIKASKACIEYVVIHELCHLIYPRHNKQFFRLLNTMMPDWEKWKERLERSMA